MPAALPRVRRRRHLAPPMSALVVAVVALAGCTSSGNSDDKNGGKGGPPARGGTLTIAVSTDPGSLNPRAVTSTSNRDVTRSVLDSLLALDPASKKPVPWLARSYEANADATQFTFHLRSGVTFSDGTPLTAEVVKANFDDILTNAAAGAGGSPLLQLSQGGYVGTKVVDNLTFVQTFKSPDPAWPVDVTSPDFGILARATLSLPFQDRFNKIVGTGPFLLDSYVKNSQVVLTRRTGYKWAPSFAANKGDAYLSKVVLKVVPEAGVRTGALQSGQIQVATSLQPADVTTVEGGGFKVLAQPIPRNAEALVVTGADRSPLNDLAVRQAIVKAINATQIRDSLLSPQFKVPTSMFTSSVIGYANESALLRSDPDGAKSLLQQAGWVEGSNGVREKNGQKLSVQFGWLDRGNPWDKPMVELLKAQLAKVGVDLNPVLATVPQAVAALQAHNKYDLFLAGNAGGIDADQGLRGTFTDTAPNFYNIQDKPLQPLLQKQAVTADATKRAAVLRQIQERVITQGISIPLVEDTALVAEAKRVHGFALGADARTPSLTDVWLS